MTIFFKGNKPVMIAVGGLSGSGKSTLAVEIGKNMRNAVVLDSDVEHKRLRGVEPTAKLDDGFYTKENIQDFIQHIRSKAKQHLRAGQNVIVTGTFLDKVTRGEQEELARHCHAEFIGIYLHASTKVLFDRVARRKDTASDADKRVLKRQIKALQEEQQRMAGEQNRPQQPYSDRAAHPPRPFREIRWQIINAEQPLEDMLKSAILYIHQEKQRMKFGSGSNRNKTKKKQGGKPSP